jgi:hypothetical protein
MGPAASKAQAGWETAPSAFVVLRDSGPAAVRAFAQDLERAGGHVAIVYPPRSAVVFADATALADAAVIERITSAHRTEVDAGSLREFGGETERAGMAWSASLALEPQGLGDEPLHGVWPDALRRPQVLGKGLESPQTAINTHRPLGAEYYDTSEFMAGTSVVGVWLLEAAGATYEWTTSETNQTLGGVQSGLANWVRKGGPSAFLTFTLDIHTSVPVSGVPIENPMTDDATWAGEALTNAGYAGANAFERCFAYNNAMRDLYDTNWCYSIFIADSNPAVNQGLFSGGGYAWAYFGGPWIYMSRYSTWAYNFLRYYAVVPMHETGHIFMDTDEYNTALEYAGYLNAPDNPSGTVQCIMNQNDSTRVCPDTRNQIGWRDLDVDSVIEPLDVAPAVQLAVYSPDPTSNATPTWTGAADVMTLPNLNPMSNYFPPHDQTIVTIDSVECRVDGGPWSAASPGDGTFNGYSESFSWTSPSLGNGIHVAQARARTSVGIWSDVFATDTLTIAGAVGVDSGSPPALASVAVVPNPLQSEAQIFFATPSDGEVRLEVYSIEGRRIRVLLAGARSAGAGRIAWDGLDDGGRPVRSGLYIVRLLSPSGAALTKTVIMR